MGRVLGPLLLVAAVVAVGGAAAPRRADARGGWALLLHVLVVAVVVWLMIGGSLLHPVAGAHDRRRTRFADAWTSVGDLPAAGPGDACPGIAPAADPVRRRSACCVVDVLACWLRRVPLAGLPLLAVYCVPISLLGDGVSWVVFLLAAAGFLLMMFLHESAHITRWGRPLGGTAAPASTPTASASAPAPARPAPARSAAPRWCWR